MCFFSSSTRHIIKIKPEQENNSTREREKKTSSLTARDHNSGGHTTPHTHAHKKPHTSHIACIHSL